MTTNQFAQDDAPLCRECLEPMKEWPGQLYICWNEDCPQAGEPVDPPEDGGGSSQGDGYYSSERMAAAQRIGQ